VRPQNSLYEQELIHVEVDLHPTGDWQSVQGLYVCCCQLFVNYVNSVTNSVRVSAGNRGERVAPSTHVVNAETQVVHCQL
jgi:hypothetical protein